MNKQGHHETVTIRMTPRLLEEVDDTTRKLAFTTLWKMTQHDNDAPTRSATIRFLIQVGINYLKKPTSSKGPRTGKKRPSTTGHHSG